MTTSSTKLLWRLFACTLIGFFLIMLVYIYNGGSVANRFGYATFMSLTPALITFVMFRWRHWKPSPGVVALVYFTMFILGTVIQSVLR